MYDIADEVYGNRDVQTALDVDEMARLGRFGGQFIAYGTAVKEQDNRIHYYASADEEKLYKHMEEKQLTGLYFTPIVSLQKRTQVPSGMEESILSATKYALLSQMKRDYEHSRYFEWMEPLYERKANNLAQPLLDGYRNRIEGNFDDTELQLFVGTLNIAYQAKVLSQESYNEFLTWHQKIRAQMEDDPVVEDNIGRTLYGFTAWQKGKRECIFDAKEISVIHRRHRKMLQGAIVTPIIKRSYWFRQFGDFKNIKSNHCLWLSQWQDEAYFKLLQEIKALEGVIGKDEIIKLKEKLKDTPNALQAVCYYEKIWNLN